MNLSRTLPDAPQPMRRPKRALRRALAGICGALLLSTLAIGALHTKPGRTYLMRFASFSGCPIGGASAAQTESVRRAAVAHDRGVDTAPFRPALGFQLDRSTVADVRAWASSHRIDCAEYREATYVSCAHVPAGALSLPSSNGELSEVSFAFTREGPLVSVTALYSHQSDVNASAIARRAKAEMEQQLGPAPKTAGSFDLPGGVATLSYRYRDYAADMTTARVPGSGFVVREAFTSVL